MIIVCPQCDARFVVPSTVFAKGGRKVRCSECANQWFQDAPLGDEEKPSFRDNLDMVSHDNDDKISLDDGGQSKGILGAIAHDFVNGYRLIAGVALLMIIAFFSYRMIMPPMVMGDGLAFNNLTLVESETDEGLILSGEIVNSVNQKRGVPSLQITFMVAGGNEGDMILLSPDKDALDSGEVLPISFPINISGEGVENIRVTFAGQ